VLSTVLSNENLVSLFCPSLHHTGSWIWPYPLFGLLRIPLERPLLSPGFIDPGSVGLLPGLTFMVHDSCKQIRSPSSLSKGERWCSCFDKLKHERFCMTRVIVHTRVRVGVTSASGGFAMALKASGRSLRHPLPFKGEGRVTHPTTCTLSLWRRRMPGLRA
jgi:hypothetical protein